MIASAQRSGGVVGTTVHGTKNPERRVLACEVTITQRDAAVHRELTHVLVGEALTSLKLGLKAGGAVALELSAQAIGPNRQTLVLAASAKRKLLENAGVGSEAVLEIGALSVRVGVTETYRHPSVISVQNADGSTSYRDRPEPQCGCVESKRVESCCMQSPMCFACIGSGCENCGISGEARSESSKSSVEHQ